MIVNCGSYKSCRIVDVLSPFFFSAGLGRRRDDIGGCKSAIGINSFVLRAITRNMASLATPIAGLSSSTQRAAIRGIAVATNMTELTTGIALHCLSLAVSGKMIGTSTLIAGSRACPTETTATEGRATKATTSDGTSASNPAQNIGRTVPCKMAHITARVATTTVDSTRQPQSRTISLNMAQALAMITLLALRCPRMRARVRLVTRLLAVVAKAFSRRANFSKMTDGATLVAGTSRQGGHGDYYSGA